MCGFVGVVTSTARSLSIDDPSLIAMRDELAHRGPDGSGLWRNRFLALAHRRLAVLDPSPAGHQPMVSPHSGSVLVYNGELYNDPELRRALAREGRRCSTGCDTETLQHALDAWGEQAARRLRGMYAFAHYDPASQRLLLARDPLGIKPLYLWQGLTADGPTLIFASEPRSILRHPGVRTQPNYRAISAYLTTIRTTMGRQTLFEGIEVVRPGEWIRVDLRDSAPALRRTHYPIGSLGLGAGDCFATAADARAATRETVEDSVRAHLRSDVPVCTLLSGGLDSSIIAGIATEAAGPIRSFAAGAAPDPDQFESSDLTWARRVATDLGAQHTTVTLDAGSFLDLWRSLVAQVRTPLSTPNETAIHAVASALRAQGQVVALSGEGADELFAGYAGPLLTALDHIEQGDADPGLFQLDANAWIARGAKPAVLNPGVLQAADGDESLVETWRAEFRAAAEGLDEAHPLCRHLAFQQRINLAGLLQRLDTAMMLAGVEGRTPFADIAVARLACSLPMEHLIRVRTLEIAGAGGVATVERELDTKIVLRQAFGHRLPPSVLARPKQSFPVPFQEWMTPMAGMLESSDFARHLFSPGAIALVRAQPARHWHLAWPMVNIALWGAMIWG
ncbi:MAG: asparagine synthase (glutamine-hydrolyzing) [Phycisphaerales bacterium JB037]